MPPRPPQPPQQPERTRREPEEFLPFRPWMLALAVLLGCALGVAIMEDLRGPREMLAQADVRRP